MKQNFSFNDVLSALTHIRGGIPVQRLTSRIRLGEHRSMFFGPSNDMFDIQEYDPERDQPNAIVDIGDDDIIYARRCIEPHEVKINFLADLSHSISSGQSFHKRKMLLEAMGFIGVTGIRYQDPVGIIGFTDKIVLNIAPKCGATNFYHMLRTAYEFLENENIRKKNVSKTDFFIALDFVRRYFNNPCFIPVISDFVDLEKVISSPILRAVAAKHEMMFIFLDDPAELTSAAGMGFIRMEDIETGRRYLVSRSKLSKAGQEIRAKRKEIRNELRRLGIQSVVLEYGKHFNRLYKFFEARRKARNSR